MQHAGACVWCSVLRLRHVTVECHAANHKFNVHQQMLGLPRGGEVVFLRSGSILTLRQMVFQQSWLCQDSFVY